MGAMFLGIFLFALAALAVVIVFLARTSERHAERQDLPAKDQLSDADFRRIEYGDDV